MPTQFHLQEIAKTEILESLDIPSDGRRELIFENICKLWLCSRHFGRLTVDPNVGINESVRCILDFMDEFGPRVWPQDDSSRSHLSTNTYDGIVLPRDFDERVHDDSEKVTMERIDLKPSKQKNRMEQDNKSYFASSRYKYLADKRVFCQLFVYFSIVNRQTGCTPSDYEYTNIDCLLDELCGPYDGYFSDFDGSDCDGTDERDVSDDEYESDCDGYDSDDSDDQDQSCRYDYEIDDLVGRVRQL